jgi:glutamate synthase domain-containing protein 2
LRNHADAVPLNYFAYNIVRVHRTLPTGLDCHSHNRFEEFDDAPSLLDFIERVRKLTGKPIGLKVVVGSTAEVDELCREIRKRGDGPDFIAVDGNEGGSGAAYVVGERARARQGSCAVG